MLITTALLTIVFAIVLLFIVNQNNKALLQLISGLASGFVLIISSLILANFENNLYHFQELTTYKLDSKLLNFSLSFGLDGISVYFFFLKCSFNISMYIVYMVGS